MKIPRLIVLLPCLLLSLPVFAQSTMRCGTNIVSVGDRGFEIRRKCGEPSYRDTVGYTVGRYHRLEQSVEEWVYGPVNGMTYILRIQGNRLIEIESKRIP